jgi:hypothetical protein
MRAAMHLRPAAGSRSVKLVLAALCAVLVLAPCAVSAQTMTVTATADRYLTFYRNGVVQILTAPAGCASGATQTCPASGCTTTSFNCPYQASFPASYGDTFAFQATYVSGRSGLLAQFAWNGNICTPRLLGLSDPTRLHGADSLVFLFHQITPM